jgi:hypothetical protein
VFARFDADIFIAAAILYAGCHHAPTLAQEITVIHAQSDTLSIIPQRARAS